MIRILIADFFVKCQVKALGPTASAYPPRPAYRAGTAGATVSILRTRLSPIPVARQCVTFGDIHGLSDDIMYSYQSA